MKTVKATQDAMELQEQITDLMKRYYTYYYRDTVGLPDWEKRVDVRLDEERNYAESTIKRIESWLTYGFSGKRVLVVGAGTGAEALGLVHRGAEVYGIEPNKEALEILRLKAQLHDIDQEVFVDAPAESIPFPDNYFDFVYCYTVLEHVNNIERALDEMIRVTKAMGRIFIGTPDYRVPYEPHYKMLWIPYLPNFLKRQYLKLRRRPSDFIKTINFTNANYLKRLLQHRPVVTMQVYHPFSEDFLNDRSIVRRLVYLYATRLGIQRDQWYIIFKLKPKANYIP